MTDMLRASDPLTAPVSLAVSALDELPVGVIRVVDGLVVEANPAFIAWAGGTRVVGRPVSELLVEADDFLDGVGRVSTLMQHPLDPDRAAFVMRRAVTGGTVLTVTDASDRAVAGRALRQSHALADRTRTRLQLVIDASIAFSAATSESRLADILADTMARAYRAERSAVLVLDSAGALQLVAGENPLADHVDIASISAAAQNLHEVITVSGAGEGFRIAPQVTAAMEATGIQALLVAPVHQDGTTLGIVVCFFDHARAFDEEAAPLADALAGQAGQALVGVRLQQQLLHLAMHDETTGLPNRRMLEARTAASGGGHTAVVFIDLDGFKDVNDQLGHDRGDDVLREVATRLRGIMRDSDVIARYGGDEFVVIVDASTEAAALDIAERLRAAVQEPMPFLPPALRLGASIGVCVAAIGETETPIDEMLRLADQAMYRAKASGGNRIEVVRG